MGITRSVITHLILTALCAILTGCATKPNFSPAAPASKGKSLIYAYREKDNFRDSFGPGKYLLIMDGQKVATFRKATYLPFSVEPRKHKFEYRISGAAGQPGMSAALNTVIDDHFLEVDLKEGQTYYLLFGNPNYWLKLVDESQALRQLKNCHIVEPKHVQPRFTIQPSP